MLNFLSNFLNLSHSHEYLIAFVILEWIHRWIHWFKSNYLLWHRYIQTSWLLESLNLLDCETEKVYFAFLGGLDPKLILSGELFLAHKMLDVSLNIKFDIYIWWLPKKWNRIETLRIWEALKKHDILWHWVKRWVGICFKTWFLKHKKLWHLY